MASRDVSRRRKRMTPPKKRPEKTATTFPASAPASSLPTKKSVIPRSATTSVTRSARRNGSLRRIGAKRRT